MKFAKELEQDAVPEWRVKYLNYKQGKKHVKAVIRAINRAAATPTLARRAEADQHHYKTPSTYFNIGHNFTPPPPKANDDGLLGGEPDETGKAKAVKVVATPRDDERSGLARSPGSEVQYGSFGPVPSRSSYRHDFELPAPAMRVPSRTSEHGAPSSPPLNRLALHRSASMVATVPSGYQTPSKVNLGADGTPRQRMSRLFTTGSTHTRNASNRFTGGNKMEIGMQNLDSVRSAERDFFAFLDSELAKIESFYKEKEDQATERLMALRAQLHEMRNRRTAEITEARKKRETGRNRSPSDDDAGEQQDKDGSRDWIAPLKGKFFKPGPNSKALQKMTQTPVMHPQNVDEGRDYVRRPPGDDVPYRSAKRKLKVALQEFYRGLELLKSYALLNRTAFRKLNKKYDKAVKARPSYRYMNEKVNKSWFVNSDILDGHIRTVEDLYARYFERGNHKIAAGKLRNLNKRAGDSSDSAFRSGITIGLGGVFAVQGLIYGAELLFSEDDDLRTQTAYLMQLYGGYFLVLFLFILFTLDCRMWTKNKVNYPFIFEFDQRNFLDWKQVAEFPSFFFALLGVFMWLNFSRLGDWEEMYLYYPVVLICITLGILFFPAPILHHKARRWFLYSHYRLLLSGLYPVEFRDFFLGDIWCSLTYATCNIELFFCLYANSWYDPEQCNSSHSRLMGFFGALPPIWRALQCIRRYYDTKNVFPHLVNCGKYTMTILTAVFLSLYRIENSQANLSLFITFGTVNAIYCSIWDLFMDFSLLQAGARQKLLRNITALRPVSIYYIIMTLDPILRFSWIFYAIFTHDSQHSTIVSFLVAFAEVFRRGIWTLLRVENEHCANVAQYKASRDTPLPYHLNTSTSSVEDTTPPAQQQQQPPAGLLGPAAINPATPGVDQQDQIRPLGQHHRKPSTIPPRTPASQVLHRTPTNVGGGTPQSIAVSDTPAEESGPAAAFRRRYTDTIGKKSILQAMAEAHKQDFEKKRLPLGSEPSSTARRGSARPDEGDDEEIKSEEEEEEDDDEDDETGSVEEERMRVREAEGLVNRARGVNAGSESD
ncbi:Xenotropic and polytropic retrovirus receptor 1 [Podospora pseudocomata]|uniref:Xenotropic and polytropic retrovirus receptor 1 n=1 Tax=Podospora pseudocomata TaxID=2093779 RepID=A0ABR0GMT9_9PEZI|nr:Xenotropic and polytropic retrovirus receptor 1 [Podospora pseudocomata]